MLVFLVQEKSSKTKISLYYSRIMKQWLNRGNNHVIFFSYFLTVIAHKSSLIIIKYSFSDALIHFHLDFDNFHSKLLVSFFIYFSDTLFINTDALC